MGTRAPALALSNMPGTGAQAAIDGKGRHLVLYDGVCGLCNRLLQRILEQDKRGVFHFASLQGPVARAALAPFGKNPDALDTFYAIENYGGGSAKLFDRGRAAVFVATELGWPWRAAGLAGVLPDTVLDRAYDRLARSRYRIFGQLDHCLLPDPKYRGRFLDEAPQ
jgi:predicted DCC family thiol-disulfide oxidoreductase YuxK